MRKCAIFWVFAVVMLVTGGNVLADDVKPSGKIVIDETQVGVGVQKVHITGDVYHLENVKDFPGNYVELEASAAVIKGKGGLWLKNKKGVTLNLKSNNDGLMLSLSAGSLQISMN